MRKYVNKIEQLTKFLDFVQKTAINLSWKAVPKNMQEQALDMLDKVVAEGAKKGESTDQLIDQYAGSLKEKCPEVVTLAKQKLKSAINQAIEEIKKDAA